MIMGLVLQSPDRMPNAWQHPGLQGLDALYGLSDGQPTCGDFAPCLPPIGICKDATGKVVDCGTQTGTGGPCDPTFVAMGYSCYVDASGQVTYVGPGGSPPPPTPAAGGTGTTGAAAGAGAGSSPSPGGKPPAPPTPSWIIWALAGAVLVFGAKAVS